MLAEFRVSNYRSFKDEQVLSMIASSEESKGKNSVEIGKYNILKSAVVYGANASGKSNLIKAMSCMNEIVLNSARYMPGQLLPVVPFAFDEKTKQEPSTFEVTFFLDGIRYQYGFAATSKRITREYLLSWPKGRAQTWFEIDVENDEPYFGPSLKGDNKAIWQKVTENSLFLTTAVRWNHKQLAYLFMMWFFGNFNKFPSREIGIKDTSEFLLYNVIESKENAPELCKMMFDFLKNADFGIDDIDIQEVAVDEHEIYLQKMSHAMNNKTKNPPLRKRGFKVNFIHSGGKYSLPLEEESDGTQRFFSLLNCLHEAIVAGYVLLEDELEQNIHPLLARKIIELLRDVQFNDSYAQLIFATHDTTLLDPELFGRDQVWFTEKDKQGATQLYSLADYKETVRKGEPMQKRYLAGRYGAIPILERF